VKWVARVQINETFPTKHQAAETLLTSQFRLFHLAKATCGSYPQFPPTVETNKFSQISVPIIFTPFSQRVILCIN
jgi:hypothetical protein